MVIFYLWWDTPIFIFPPAGSAWSGIAERSTDFLYVFHPQMEYMIDASQLSMSKWIFFKLLSAPGWPLGIVGIVSWSLICRAVIYALM